MLKSNKKDNKAFMPLSLTTIALFITTAILLISIYSLIQDHPLKTKTELETISTSLHQKIQTVETSYYEKQSQFLFKSNSLQSNIQLSSNSIIIEQKHKNQQYRIVKKSIVPWWIQLNNSFWNDSNSFHQYLKYEYHYAGTISDPIPNNESIKQEIQNSFNNSTSTILRQPYKINTLKPLHIDKLIIYYKDENGLIVQENTQSFILLYQ